MKVLIFIILLIIGSLLHFIVKPKTKFVYNLAYSYVFIVMFTSIFEWLFYFAGIKNAVLLRILKFLLDWGAHSEHLILGYLSAYILLALNPINISADTFKLKKIIRLTLWGITILIGNKFIIGTVGKAVQLDEMINYFTIWGYAIWFLYFIMVAETAGAVGILLHFKLKTGPLAASGLLLIMLGAVYTHWHNHDPFSDSYAAVIQFINLSVILFIYHFEKRAIRKQSDTYANI